MKTALKIIVGLGGGLLALMFIILAIHDKSLGFAFNALVSALATATIIRVINKKPDQGNSASRATKVQRQVAIGLAIGFLGSIALFKATIWWLKHQ